VVAESADGWNAFLMPVEDYRRKLSVLASRCEQVGRDPADIRKALVFGLITGEHEAEVALRAERMAQAFKVPMDVLRRRVLVGTPEQLTEQLLGFTQVGVSDFLVATRAPFDYDTLRLFIEVVAPLVRETAELPGAMPQSSSPTGR
jgi:alkanesulfonate monooxygenase SsuD/methylene tetrahydromethanopterin reductase-like flavin-dependent oxidoreductase (luciferase family)